MSKANDTGNDREKSIVRINKTARKLTIGFVSDIKLF